MHAAKLQILPQLDSLDTDKKYLIQIDTLGNIIIEEVRQSCDYIKVHNLFRKNPSAFAKYVNPPCALPKTKDCLEHLFRDSRVNKHLLNICKFKGHATSLSWTTVQTFSELLSLVPKELTRVLGRLAEFWENVASLTESRAEIYEDTKSIEKVSGLWPTCCSADRKTLRGLKKTIFPKISKQQKDTILKYMENSKFRVPTMGLVISEANFFLCIAKGVNERLGTDGNGFRLQCSEIRKNNKTVLDEQAYLRYFLDAAQRSNYSRMPRHLKGKRETNCRRVTDSANFCKSGTPTEIFDENVLRTVQPRYVNGHLPVCLVVKDFLESFLGPSVLQDHNKVSSRDQVNRLSVLIRVSNLEEEDDGSTRDSSKWNSKVGSHNSRFVLKPFRFEPQAIMSQNAGRKRRSTKAPDYTSEKGEICSPEILPKDSDPMHIGKQDAGRCSGIGQAMNDQNENSPENAFYFEKKHRNRSKMDTDSRGFREQARCASKAIPGTCSQPDFEYDICYGPFLISCMEEMNPISSKSVHAVAPSSVYSSDTLIAESSNWDAQTLVTSQSEIPTNGGIWHVEHESMALRKMLGMEVANIHGKEVLTDAWHKLLP